MRLSARTKALRPESLLRYHPQPDFTSTNSRACFNHAARLHAFELLAVIAIIALLTAMRRPALSATKIKVQGISCLNNTKQLALAGTMYAGDFNDLPVPDSTDFLWAAERTPRKQGPQWSGGRTVTQLNFTNNPMAGC